MHITKKKGNLAALVVSASAVFALQSTAMAASVTGFTGAYAPSQFTFANSDFTDGSVDTNGAPSSITLTGGNSQGLSAILIPGFTDYFTTAQSDAEVSFDWAYDTDDLGFAGAISFYDRLFFFSRSVPADPIITQLTNDALGDQSGRSTFNVLKGDLFGFYIATEDNGNGAASVTISNFSVTDTTSIPTPALLPGLIGLGAGFARKRRALAERQMA